MNIHEYQAKEILRAQGVPIPPGEVATTPEQAEAIVALRLTPAIFSLAVAKALSEAAYRRRTTISVHVKIDTGMGRIGI
ncbi:MAG: alanine racemase, partial [Gemmatimonadota bacterium]|nr:alanine racemase [Gemmatimonadota bacterium]